MILKIIDAILGKLWVSLCILFVLTLMLIRIIFMLMGKILSPLRKIKFIDKYCQGVAATCNAVSVAGAESPLLRYVSEMARKFKSGIDASAAHRRVFFAAILVLLLIILALTERSCSEQRGMASWYGPGFYGKPTASGEIFRADLYTAAHKTLPLGTKVTVINLNNNKRVKVKINDRGPFVEGRIIDLSKIAAEKLDMLESGVAPVVIIQCGKP
jgi:rare lipoprotein A